MSKIRVAIVGVGNCANSLIQGIKHYGPLNEEHPIGLVRPRVGPYSVSDIEIVAAFDVIKGKVGEDLFDAIWAHPNDTLDFARPEGKSGVIVQRGPTHDGLGLYLSRVVEESEKPVVSVNDYLREKQVDVVINYLPVGSEHAAKFYATEAIRAGCGFVNCMPVFIASDPEWESLFVKAGLPIIGDDIKSQVGATIVHRQLATLFRDRGVILDKTMQLNVGGNGDFMNMLERERLTSKKISKTNSVVSIATHLDRDKDVHIGPSDYVSWLTDRKWAYIRMEGRGFGGAPINIEMKLEVWDSPNSAGIVIDAVRCAKLAKDNEMGGAIIPASAYFMKTPPKQFDDSVALKMLENFISGAVLPK